MERFELVIVGAGPAGLSAAARAAEVDRRNKRTTPSYVLLEASAAPAKTIQYYQKGKHVMAEPGFLALRSDVRFAAGTRETILGNWGADLEKLGVHIRYGDEVMKISGASGDFTIGLASKTELKAAKVLLAIGLEGNPRRVGAPGETEDTVQYRLVDPKEYLDETIIVVGAGDSAIENALALAAQNDVWIINRGKEFSRAKDANLAAVVGAINDKRNRLNCFYETKIRGIKRNPPGSAKALTASLQTATGEREIELDRIIARLGAEPPRKFVEAMGIRFPNERRDSIPELSREYESNVPGIFIIGSLAGYPLIKQAMNQGYDVVEFLNGNRIKPADHPLLEYLFHGLPFEREVDDVLDRLKEIVPMFRQLNALMFRELIIESEMIAAYPAGPELEDARRRMQQLAGKLAGAAVRITRVLQEGDAIYKPGEYGTSFFTIVQGEVTLQHGGPQPWSTQLTRGEFFGETSLLSGRPRLELAIAGPGCIVVETPRRTMIKLMNSNDEVRSGIDWIFVVRELQRHFAPRATFRDLRGIASRAPIQRFEAGKPIFTEGETGDCLYIVRSGTVSLSRRTIGAGGGEVDRVIEQVQSGQMVGEMALMGDPVRRESARAAVATELIQLKRKEFLELVQRDDARLNPFMAAVSRHAVDRARMQVRPESGELLGFLMAQGLGEATNVLVIDDSLCVGCDNCEKACAETHGGIARLDREAGPSRAHIHIPISCRHCEQPHCMKDCPPNAIRRAPSGEVYINESCIGCGNCESNCPYDVIKMAYDAPKKPGLLQWLLLGRGAGPGEEPDYHPTDKAKAKGKKAVKCDACVGLAHGPACVAACPTGAALRIGPAEFVELVEDR
jgi:Fe-S-cluster-containing hydrogenase component 2/thioredoxin reductase/CRP-like cAMP-binding protein